MSGGGVGRFRDDAAHEHYLAAYRTGMAALPAVDAQADVPTAYGTVRVYRFAGPVGTPAFLLPGRNAATPLFAANLGPLLRHRTVYCIDLLGEAGLSVQTRPVVGPDDQATWLHEPLAGLDLPAVHLVGVSIGDWAAVNVALRRPDRLASLTLLDPALTFARIPVRTMLAVAPMAVPGVPPAYRKRVLNWLAGGADVDDTVPEAALISAGTTDFVLRQPIPRRFTDVQVRALGVPVLALVAGRSVIHRPLRAAQRARRLLANGHVELWPDASHAMSGEYAEAIAERAQRFWTEVDQA